MNKMEMKKLLIKTLMSEEQLYDFGLECVEYIFKGEMQDDFKETYEILDEGYGLSLTCMLHNHKKRIENAEKIRIKETELKATSKQD